MGLKPIFTALSPNLQRDDIWLSFKLLFQPWKWKEGEAVGKIEQKFRDYLGLDYSFSFNSGRSSLLALLKSLDLDSGQEVLIQGFTCNAAVVPILEADLEPIFIDINPETLNMDPEDLKKKIGDRSKVVVVQHTFGLPADLEEIKEVCERHNLILIEDCAHALSSTYQDKKVGTFGKAAFFSFGRNKIISSVYGGMVVTSDPVLGERLKNHQKETEQPGSMWIYQQLIHPVFTGLIKASYNFLKLGRLILGVFQKLKVFSRTVSQKEKEGELPSSFPARLPNALAHLALNQFEKLEEFNSHRRAIADFYDEQLKETEFTLPPNGANRTYMRYPVLTSEDTDQILKEAQQEKIFLDDGWRKAPVVPPDTDLESMRYSWGVCPEAEKVADKVVNLPTHINISLDKAQRIVEFLKEEL